MRRVNLLLSRILEELKAHWCSSCQEVEHLGTELVKSSNNGTKSRSLALKWLRRVGNQLPNYLTNILSKKNKIFFLYEVNEVLFLRTKKMISLRLFKNHTKWDGKRKCIGF